MLYNKKFPSKLIRNKALGFDIIAKSFIIIPKPMSSSSDSSFFSSFFFSSFFGSSLAAAGAAAAAPGAGAEAPEPMLFTKSLTLTLSKALAKSPGQYGSIS
ncbi:hypothetical protein BpHYR1_039222 [Brachionus plicatilis]|uniref:Uncharacterized protein n=1 Tax=Brachionus plicatilis TaxID=10195 RepID=A0A3M7P5B1_BRAPC|nr:hypothetical protein BpHYR1_039222 [Brachionus plicatilis]